MDQKIYQIVRFYRWGPRKRRIIRQNVTLKTAERHCKRKDTRSPSGRWFDGYEYMDDHKDRAGMSGIQKVLAVNHVIKHGGTLPFSTILHKDSACGRLLSPAEQDEQDELRKRYGIL